MATIQKRGNSYRILFAYAGKRHTFTLGEVSQREAETKADQVDYLLMRLKQGFVKIPPDMTVTAFLENDGRVPQRSPPGVVTFQQLQDAYLQTIANGSIEANSLQTVTMHLGHFRATLGDRFRLQTLGLNELQAHVSRRKHLSPVTLRKEMASFRTMWNWGVHAGHLQGSFPNKGIRYPKGEEKPPFRTWDEIEAALLGVPESARDRLWDNLYLRPSEIAELLDFIRANAPAAWLYPMVATAAYTGARRSELLRIEVADLEPLGTLLLRERKRSQTQRTSRRVPLSPRLRAILQEWSAVRPAGRHLFCQPANVARSKTNRSAPTQITRDEAHDHLKRTVAGSKWRVLRGYHTLRHSFISCLASAAIDQRIIDEFVGHQTDEQRKRYRHLFPEAKDQAIVKAFG